METERGGREREGSILMALAAPLMLWCWVLRPMPSTISA